MKRHIAYVILADDKFPTGGQLVTAINRRLPEFTSKSSDKSSPSMAGTLGKQLVIIMFVAVPNPLSANESFIRAAWWWPNVKSDLAKRRAHVIVSLAASGDENADQFALAKLSAAVIETTRSIGIIWDKADAIWPADMFKADVDAAKDGMPSSMAISVKLARDTKFPKKDGQPAWLAMTYGLRSFGMRELEYRGFEGDVQELVALLMNFSAYLLKKGDVFKDNDTLGYDLNRAHVVKIEPSTLETGKEVYRLRPGKGRASPSQVKR